MKIEEHANKLIFRTMLFETKSFLNYYTSIIYSNQQFLYKLDSKNYAKKKNPKYSSL